LPASREELRTFGALLSGQLGCSPFKPSRPVVVAEMPTGLDIFFISQVLIDGIERFRSATRDSD
jgi:hypothetical protein